MTATDSNKSNDSKSEPAKWRVLIVHNAYQMYGGEDVVVESEIKLLQEYGHEVEIFRRHNDELNSMTAWDAVTETLWSQKSMLAIDKAIHHFRPHIVHCHNTFPLISPSAYWSAHAARVPLVQTLHNFRLHCPQAMYLRDGKVCEDCLGGLPWRSVIHGCYRGSRTQSAVVTGMLTLHRALRTYQNKVIRYIALNEFCREKFIEGGLPADRIVVKPNYVNYTRPPPTERDGFLFVGRLSVEKGLDVLARAWDLLDATGSLRIAGTGPESKILIDKRNLVTLGSLTAAQVRDEMIHSSALVLPSISYDSFPRTLVEAFASALPVIASRLGPLAHLIEDEVTGLLFEPGDSADLAQKLLWARSHPDKMLEMGSNARAKYEAEYSQKKNYERLLEIYGEAIDAFFKSAV